MPSLPSSWKPPSAWTPSTKFKEQELSAELSVENLGAAIAELTQLVALFRESQGETLEGVGPPPREDGTQRAENPEERARRTRFFAETHGEERLRTAVAMLLVHRHTRRERIFGVRVAEVAFALVDAAQVMKRPELDGFLERKLQRQEIPATNEERTAIIDDILGAPKPLSYEEAYVEAGASIPHAPAFHRVAVALTNHLPCAKDMHWGPDTLEHLAGALRGKGASRTQDRAFTALEEEPHGAAALRVALEALLPRSIVDKVVDTAHQELVALISRQKAPSVP